MEIYPVYTKLNQLCNPEETFFKLLTGYSPCFLFLSNSNSKHSRYTIIGRNPYISINKNHDFIRLQVANEFFDINSSKINLENVFNDILNVLKFNEEKELDNEIPFYCGFSCQKFSNNSICFIPTEVIVFDNLKNNLTAIVNTYHKESFDPEILFRANVKIARIIEDLKKQCSNSDSNNNFNNEKIDISLMKNNCYKIINCSNFEIIYRKVTSYFSQSHISVFFNGNTKIISVAYNSSFKTDTSGKRKDIFEFINKHNNFSGYFSLNNKSDFAVPLFTIINKSSDISVCFSSDIDIKDLYINNFFNIIT